MQFCTFAASGRCNCFRYLVFKCHAKRGACLHGSVCKPAPRILLLYPLRASARFKPRHEDVNIDTDTSDKHERHQPYFVGRENPSVLCYIFRWDTRQRSAIKRELPVNILPPMLQAKCRTAFFATTSGRCSVTQCAMACRQGLF